MKYYFIFLLFFVFFVGCEYSSEYVDENINEEMEYSTDEMVELEDRYELNSEEEYEDEMQDFVYEQEEYEPACYKDVLFMSIPCPSDEWELIADNKWRKGEVYFEIISGTDSPELVGGDGYSLVAGKPELYSGMFDGFYVGEYEGVTKAMRNLDKARIDTNVFRYNNNEYTGVETIFTYYRNYYDTQWIIVRSYGPNIDVSEEWQPIHYATEESVELI
jgi:hypothetical protein